MLVNQFFLDIALKLNGGVALNDSIIWLERIKIFILRFDKQLSSKSSELAKGLQLSLGD